MDTIENIINNISNLSDKKGTVLIAIDGRGGSGKSTLAEKLKKELPNATIVHLDDFAYPNSFALSSTITSYSV